MISTYLFIWLSLILCVPKCMLLLLLLLNVDDFKTARQIEGRPFMGQKAGPWSVVSSTVDDLITANQIEGRP